MAANLPQRRHPAAWLLPGSVLLMVAWIAQCSDSGRNTTGPGASGLTITSLTPARTAAGDTVVVAGSEFGAAQDSSAVLFSSSGGTSAATVVGSWSATSLRVLVPQEAVSGPVRIRKGGVESNGAAFEVAPQLRTFADDVLPIVQSRCAVTGCHVAPSPQNGFLPDTREGMLTTGLHAPDVVPRHSSESIVIQKLRGSASFGARMPYGGPYLSDEEILRIADWIDQGARPDLVPPPPLPQITTLVPPRTFPGDTLVVGGLDFGADQGTSAVLFTAAVGDTVAAEVLAWSDTSLRVLVPSGAAGGPLLVRTGNGESAPRTFEIVPEVSYREDLNTAAPRYAGFFWDHGCEGCHFGGGSLVSNMDLTSYATLMSGDSDHGPVVRRRDSDGSLIIQKLRGTTTIGERMPKGGPYLSEDQIAPLRDWIDQGARDN